MSPLLNCHLDIMFRPRSNLTRANSLNSMGIYSQDVLLQMLPGLTGALGVMRRTGSFHGAFETFDEQWRTQRHECTRGLCQNQNLIVRLYAGSARGAMPLTCACGVVVALCGSIDYERPPLTGTADITFSFNNCHATRDSSFMARCTFLILQESSNLRNKARKCPWELRGLVFFLITKLIIQ